MASKGRNMWLQSLKKENEVALDYILSPYLIIGSKHNWDA
jgi:hypothetical protein